MQKDPSSPPSICVVVGISPAMCAPGDDHKGLELEVSSSGKSWPGSASPRLAAKVSYLTTV
jgi:hypothetical protein